jgi:hypothetical protein
VDSRWGDDARVAAAPTDNGYGPTTTATAPPPAVAAPVPPGADAPPGISALALLPAHHPGGPGKPLVQHVGAAWPPGSAPPRSRDDHDQETPTFPSSPAPEPSVAGPPPEAAVPMSRSSTPPAAPGAYYRSFPSRRDLRRIPAAQLPLVPAPASSEEPAAGPPTTILTLPGSPAPTASAAPEVGTVPVGAPVGAMPVGAPISALSVTATPPIVSPVGAMPTTTVPPMPEMPMAGMPAATVPPMAGMPMAGMPMAGMPTAVPPTAPPPTAAPPATTPPPAVPVPAAPIAPAAPAPGPMYAPTPGPAGPDADPAAGPVHPAPEGPPLSGSAREVLTLLREVHPVTLDAIDLASATTLPRETLRLALDALLTEQLVMATSRPAVRDGKSVEVRYGAP